MTNRIYHSPSPGLLRLICAKDFYDPTTQQIFKRSKNGLEKTGDFLQWGVNSSLDFLMRKYNNPLVIIALTALLMLVVTIAFYPLVAWGMMVTVAPCASSITPGMLLFATYLTLQLTITGVGIRALGRLSDKQFMKRYNNGELIPLYIGTNFNKVVERNSLRKV